MYSKTQSCDQVRIEITYALLYDSKRLTRWYLGIKEYSDWPTIPQLYVDKEFIGGCDILVSMHQNGELAKLFEDKKVLAPPEAQEEKTE